MKKQTVYVIMTVALIILILPISISLGSNISAITLTFSGSISSGPSTPTYAISQIGTVTNVISEPSGTIVYSNTNANLAFAKAFSYVANGGNILVQAGTYTANGGSIRMDNCKNVVVTFQPGSLITIVDGSNDVVFDMWYDTNCTINGVNVNGNAPSQVAPFYYDNGVSMADCSNCQVTGATITNVRGYGFSTSDDRTGLPCGIVNSTITFCGWNGITLGAGGDYTIGDYAINCTVAYCSDVGITTLATGSRIIGNYVHDMNGTTGAELPAGSAHYGIAVENNGGTTIGHNLIENNTVTNCIGTWAGIGICIGTGGPVLSNLVRYNTIINCSGGIDALYSTGSVISKNQIINWGTQAGSAGIWDHGSSNEIISFNTLSSTTTSTSLALPCIIESVTNSSICNNTITESLSASGIGIDFYSASNYNVAEGNNIQAKTGIYVESGCIANRVYQNALANCTTQTSNSGTGTITTFSSPAILTLNCPINYGDISPVAGSYSKSVSSQLTITLTPNSGYAPTLNVDGVNVNLTDDSYTLSMNSDHIAYAFFLQYS